MNTDTPKKISRQFFRFDPVTTIVALITVFFTSQIVSLLIISAYPSYQKWDEITAKKWLSDSIEAQFVFYFLTEIIAIFMIYRLVKLANRKLADIGIKKPELMDVVRGIIGWAVYFVILIIFMIIASAVTNLPDQEQNIGFEQAKTSSDLLMTYLSLAIIIPIAEEVMFRGFLFSSLRAKYKFIPSAVITSIIFGFAHLFNGSENPLLWLVAIDTLMLSLIMCYVREKYDSLWPSIFVHIIKNSIAFTALFGGKL